jgi:hypothetical protein
VFRLHIYVTLWTRRAFADKKKDVQELEVNVLQMSSLPFCLDDDSLKTEIYF